MVNKVFWDFVKKIIDIKKVDCKPCHYYAKNKDKVNKLYKTNLKRKKPIDFSVPKK